MFLCVSAEECNLTAPRIYPRRGVIRGPRRHTSQRGWDWDPVRPVIEPRYVCPTVTGSPSPSPSITTSPSPTLTRYVTHRLIPVASGVLSKWVGAVYHQGRVWACPHQETSMFVFDPNTERLDLLAITPTGPGYYHGTNLVGDKVVCTPFSHTDVLVFNTLTNTTYTVPTGVSGSMKWLYGAVIGPKVYMCPRDAGTIGVYDSNTDTFTTVGSGIPFHPGCPAVGTTLVLPPNDTSPTIGLFDTTTNTYRTVPTGGPTGRYEEPCVVGTKVYMLPKESTTVLVYDALTDVVSQVASTMTAQGPCILFSGAYLIGAPQKNDQRLFIFDIHTNTTTQLISNLNYTSNYIDADYRGGAAAGNRIVFVP